jgi:hypothetical protein
LDSIADVYKKLKWIKHSVIIDHGKVVKQIFESKQVGRRKIARPRFRWFEDAE